METQNFRKIQLYIGTGTQQQEVFDAVLQEVRSFLLPFLPKASWLRVTPQRAFLVIGTFGDHCDACDTQVDTADCSDPVSESQVAVQLPAIASTMFRSITDTVPES